MTLYELTAEMAAIEDELYETGGELTPEDMRFGDFCEYYRDRI